MFGLMTLGQRAGAQGFGLGATATSNQLIGTNALTYTITITNKTGILLTNVFVTNTFSSSISVTNATTTQGTNEVEGASYIFMLGTMTNGYIAQMTLTVQAFTAGFLTNAIVVADTEITNTAATNIVTTVYNGQADLGVSFIPPVQAVITNDVTTYQVIVTNLGPNVATNIFLTNTLPPGVVLKSVNQSYSQSGTNLIFNLGTLASSSGDDILITVQPMNAGVLPVSATVVQDPGTYDPNPANNTFSTNLAVMGYLAGTLIAITNSSQSTNFQNALSEQTILLTNTGTNDVPAARIVVAGLTNQLFNAVGTNGGNPYVYYSAPIAAGQSVNLLLQYYPWRSFPFTNGQLHAFAVPLPDWTPPRAAGTSTNNTISRILKQSNGRMLIEFPITNGQTFTVVYSDNASFSNAMIAPPSFKAGANEILWGDYGPPTTISAPTNVSARFYRVLVNP